MKMFDAMSEFVKHTQKECTNDRQGDEPIHNS